MKKVNNMSSNNTRMYYNHRSGKWEYRRNRNNYRGSYTAYPRARTGYRINIGAIFVVLFMIILGSVSWLSWFFR